MVPGAEDDEIVFVVRAAVGAEFDVVDVDERRVATVGNGATSMVAAHDFAAKCWRNRLGRARWFTHVGLSWGNRLGRTRPFTHVGLAVCVART